MAGTQGSLEADERVADQEAVADAIGAADAELVSAQEAADNPITQWTCRNGTVLSLKRVPQTLIGDIAARVPKPQPPQVVADEETGRMETNPDDPAWPEALEQWAYDRSEAAFAASIAYGVRVLELGKNIVSVESDEWIEDIELVFEATDDAGIEIAREPKGKRFYHYLRYYVLDDDIDLFAVARAVSSRTTLTEKEVHQMVESFRRLVIGYPDRVGALTGWLDPDADPLAALGAGDGLGV